MDEKLLIVLGIITLGIFVGVISDRIKSTALSLMVMPIVLFFTIATPIIMITRIQNASGSDASFLPVAIPFLFVPTLLIALCAWAISRFRG